MSSMACSCAPVSRCCGPRQASSEKPFADAHGLEPDGRVDATAGPPDWLCHRNQSIGDRICIAAITGICRLGRLRRLPLESFDVDRDCEVV
jgi:hypothetical protein